MFSKGDKEKLETFAAKGVGCLGYKVTFFTNPSEEYREEYDKAKWGVRVDERGDIVVFDYMFDYAETEGAACLSKSFASKIDSLARASVMSALGDDANDQEEAIQAELKRYEAELRAKYGK